VKDGLRIMQSARNRQRHQTSAAKCNNSCGEERCAYRFVLLDWFEELMNTSANSMVLARWRPLLQIEASQQDANKTRNGSPFFLTPLVPSLRDWARIKKEGSTCEFGDYDSCVDSEPIGKSFRRFCRLKTSLLGSDLSSLPIAKQIYRYQ
jgi:hypothetical protein